MKETKFEVQINRKKQKEQQQKSNEYKKKNQQFKTKLCN